VISSTGAAVRLFSRGSAFAVTTSFQNALDFQAQIERAVFRGSKIENDVTGYKGRALEMNVVAAWRNGEEIGAVSAGNRRPDASVGVSSSCAVTLTLPMP